MIVMKFGGTSVGSSDSIEKVKEIILNENRDKIVVLSAFSGVTNLLVTINQQYESNDSTIQETIIKLEERCLAVFFIMKKPSLNPALFSKTATADK